MAKIHLAFYSAKGNLVDLLVRAWTNSRFSHVELLIDGKLYGAVPTEGVRVTSDFNLKDYTFYSVTVTEEQKAGILKDIEGELGCKYDWKGIFLSQVINLGYENTEDWFCSEFALDLFLRNNVIVGFYKPNRFSPEELLELVVYEEKQGRLNG